MTTHVCHLCTIFQSQVLRVALDIVTMRRRNLHNELHVRKDIHSSQVQHRRSMGGPLVLRGTTWDDFALLQSHADELPQKYDGVIK